MGEQRFPSLVGLPAIPDGLARTTSTSPDRGRMLRSCRRPYRIIVFLYEVVRVCLRASHQGGSARNGNSPPTSRFFVESHSLRKRMFVLALYSGSRHLHLRRNTSLFRCCWALWSQVQSRIVGLRRCSLAPNSAFSDQSQTARARSCNEQLHSYRSGTNDPAIPCIRAQLCYRPRPLPQE